MSVDRERRAEIVKLARLLGTDPEDLAYLEAVPADALARLRDQATDVLFDADSTVLAKMAAASEKLPVALVATIARHAIGALVCARVTGHMSPGRAVEIAKRLDGPFLADIAVETDPRRAASVLGRMPPDRVVAAARELMTRGEHVAMGRFVGHLSSEAIRGCVEVIEDADLLRIAFVLENKERLPDVVALLDDDRLSGVLRAAADDDLWSEAIDLLGHLNAAARRRFARLPGRDALLALVPAGNREEIVVLIG